VSYDMQHFYENEYCEKASKNYQTNNNDDQSYREEGRIDIAQ